MSENSKTEYIELPKELLIVQAEESFKSYCVSNNVKFGSKTFYKYQHIYFNAVISVIGELPPKWGVSIVSSRPIIEDYSKPKIIK